MWLFIPSASALDSRDSTLPSNSPALVCSSQSCTVNGSCPSPKSLRLALKRGRFRRLRSGLMSKQSALNRAALSFAKGQAAQESDSSQRAIPASHSVAPASAAVETIRAIFGLGSLTRLIALSRASASSRMSQATLFSDMPKSEEISKSEAIAWRRVYSRRKKLALRTSGSDCLSWPTPVVQPANGTPERFVERKRAAIARGSQMGETLSDLNLVALSWCTPGAMGGGSISRGGERIGEPLLAGQASHWATPTGAMTTGHGERQGGDNLQTNATNWPTPRSEDAESCGNHPEATDSLTGATKQWGTPTGRDWKDGDCSKANVPENGLLARQVIGLPPATTSTPGDECSTNAPGSPPPSAKRKLNFMFVQWLMGVPIGWSGTVSLERSAMESWLNRRRQRLCAYLQRLAGRVDHARAIYHANT